MLLSFCAFVAEKQVVPKVMLTSYTDSNVRFVVLVVYFLQCFNVVGWMIGMVANV